METEVFRSEDGSISGIIQDQDGVCSLQIISLHQDISDIGRIPRDPRLLDWVYEMASAAAKEYRRMNVEFITRTTLEGK